MKKTLILLTLIILFLIPFSYAASDFAFNRLYQGSQPIDGFNYSINVNQSEFWITDQGPADTVNNTQFNLIAQVLNLDESWLTSFGDGEWLELDGSNANTNIDIGVFDFFANDGFFDFLNFSFLISNFGGGIDATGDPWFLSETDLQIAENLIVNGNITGLNFLGGDGFFDNIYTRMEVDDLVGGNLELFFKNETSGISTYLIMNKTSNGSPKNESSTILSATETFLGAFISPNASDLGIKGIDEGVIEGHFHAKVDATVGKKSVSGWFKIYKRTSEGSETLLTSSHLELVDSTDEKSYESHAILINETNFDDGDRIVLKMYANISGVGGNPTLTIYIQGDTLVRMVLGTIGVNFATQRDLLNLVPYTGATANLNLGIFDFILTGTITSPTVADHPHQDITTTASPEFVKVNTNLIEDIVSVGLKAGEEILLWDGMDLFVESTQNLGTLANRFGNLWLSGKVDFGTNTINNGNMFGDWNFGSGSLTTTGDITSRKLLSDTTLLDTSASLSLNSPANRISIINFQELEISRWVFRYDNEASGGDWNLRRHDVLGAFIENSINIDASTGLITMLNIQANNINVNNNIETGSLTTNQINGDEDSDILIDSGGLDFKLLSGDMWADDFNTNSPVLDKKGRTALSYFTTTSEERTIDGSYNHKNPDDELLYSSKNVTTCDRERRINETLYDEDTKTEYYTYYYANVNCTTELVEGKSLGLSDELQRDAIFELKQEIQKRDNCWATGKDFIEVKNCIADIGVEQL